MSEDGDATHASSNNHHTQASRDSNQSKRDELEGRNGSFHNSSQMAFRQLQRVRLMLLAF